METVAIPSTLPPPDHWWSPLEYAPASASEKYASASEVDDEWNVESEEEEFDADQEQDDSVGSEADTESIELELSREQFHKSAKDGTTAVSAIGKNEKSEVDPEDSQYDKIQNFMMTLKSRLDEGKPENGQDAAEMVKMVTEDLNNQGEEQTNEERTDEEDAPYQELVSPSQNVPDQDLIQSPNFQETVRSAEYQLEQLLSTFQGLRERMVTMLDEEEEKGDESSSGSTSKDHFSDDDDASLESPEALFNTPVVDLSKQLPGRSDSQDRSLTVSTPWSESSIAHQSNTNDSVSNTQNSSVSHSYGGNVEVDDQEDQEDEKEDEDEDELPPMSPWRGVNGHAQSPNLKPSPRQSVEEPEFDLSKIRTQPSSEGSDFSAASLSHQIDGAKLTDFDDPDSLFEDEDFESEPDPYEPDSAPIIHSLTRLTMSESRRSSAQFESRRNSQQHLDASSSQSRFRHLLDANPLYNTAPASTPGFNQPSFGAPWTHITQQQQQQQQQHITQQQQRFAASQHALPEHGFGAAMAGASHLNGLLSPRAVDSASSQADHRVRFEYAPLPGGGSWGAQYAPVNESNGAGGNPGGGGGGGRSFLASLAQIGATSTSNAPSARAHSASRTSPYLGPARSNSAGLHATAPSVASRDSAPPLFSLSPPSGPTARRDLYADAPPPMVGWAGGGGGGGSRGGVQMGHVPMELQHQQQASFPPSVYAQMQRERMQGGAPPDAHSSPSLPLYASGPGLGAHAQSLRSLYSSSPASHGNHFAPSLYSSLPAEARPHLFQVGPSQAPASHGAVASLYRGAAFSPRKTPGGAPIEDIM